MGVWPRGVSRPRPGVCVSQHALRQTPPPKQMATAADSTHPTGMHSCASHLLFIGERGCTVNRLVASNSLPVHCEPQALISHISERRRKTETATHLSRYL